MEQPDKADATRGRKIGRPVALVHKDQRIRETAQHFAIVHVEACLRP